MNHLTRAALVQAFGGPLPGESPLDTKSRLVDSHVKHIEYAASSGANIVCLQELFFSPYFAADQTVTYHVVAERADGPTVSRLRDLARRLGIVIVAPFVEEHLAGVLFNTAAVIGAGGELLGTYRKHHLPHCHPGFWEKFHFTPGDGGYPVFDTPFGRVGVLICYDRHFPEPARELGLAGAEIVFNPSATVAGLSEYLWKLEQPAHAAANQYFIGAINRIGVEQPWNVGEFYGSSYFCDPNGRTIAQASRDREEVLVADLDLNLIREARERWQFFRDRRPESYTRISRA